MRFDEDGGAAPVYEPNSFGGPAEDPRYRERPYKVDSDVNRFDQREGADDYVQAGDLFRLLTAEDKASLIRNIANSMAGIPERFIKLQISHFTKADPAYGRGVAEALGPAVPKKANHPAPSPAAR